MHEVQIQIIQTQVLQRVLDRLYGFLITAHRNPVLCRDKDFLARDAGRANSLAHTYFIAIGIGGVNVAIAQSKGLHHAALRDFALGRLPGAIANARDFYAIGQDKAICKFVHTRSSFLRVL